MKALLIISTENAETAYNAMGLANGAVKKGEVCLKSHGLEGSSGCPIGWMDDWYELSREADKVFTF